MIQLTPGFLIAAANAFVGVGDDPQCTGPMAEAFTRQLREHPRRRWDAAFVSHVGYWSHYDHHADRSSWPLPVADRIRDLIDFARERNVLDPAPAIGDVFALWSAPKRRFVHTGIVLKVEASAPYEKEKVWYDCLVLSPNVHDDGRVGGQMILRLVRRIAPFKGDWFIRWTELAMEPTGEHPVPTGHATNAARRAA
jgi:hypothetical protein